MNVTGSVWRMVLLGLAALSLGGCQSYDEGVMVICESAAAVGAEELDPPARASLASIWVFEHLENPDARALFRSLAPLSPERKAEAVRRVAAEAGITECSLAELWETRWDEAWESPRNEPAPSALAVQ
jgi:hypothetical protein